MNNINYRKTTGTVFVVIAVMHALRLINGWEAVFNSWTVPMWPSWLAVVFAGWFAWTGLKK